MGWKTKRTSISIGVLLASICLVVTADRAGADTANQAAIEKGRQLYVSLCETCHGDYGRGDGPLARNLTVRPADLTDSATLGSRTDAELVKRLRYGTDNKHTPMVISQVLNEDALSDLVDYLRTLSIPGKKVSVRAGRDIYNAICWTCHGTDGKGNGPAAAGIEGTKPRDFTASDYKITGREVEVHEIISQGAAKSFHGSEYMLEWGNKLTPRQIDDVVEYLKTFQAAHAGS
jgi:mono/diheme cytochrome c family protein